MKRSAFLFLALVVVAGCRGSGKVTMGTLSSSDDNPQESMSLEKQEPSSKLVFNQSDKEDLNKCGSLEIVKQLIKHQPKNVVSATEMYILGLNDDGLLIAPTVKSQVLDNQAFIVHTNEAKSTEFKLVLRQKSNDPNEHVKYELLVKSLSEKGTKVVNALKLSITLDYNSNQWFLAKSEQVARCMIKNNLASQQCSRDSINAYIMSMLFELRSAKVSDASGALGLLAGSQILYQ
ncbi:MAG: hypothetical protein IPM57_11350 [Oligoflexia bacterium]|nr:hypothetical protein [Oligoflexia bacterium]